MANFICRKISDGYHRIDLSRHPVGFITKAPNGRWNGTLNHRGTHKVMGWSTSSLAFRALMNALSASDYAKQYPGISSTANGIDWTEEQQIAHLNQDVRDLVFHVNKAAGRDVLRLSRGRR